MHEVLEMMCYIHGLRTANEGINKRNLKIWADVADKKMLQSYLKIWEWEWIFGRAVKTIIPHRLSVVRETMLWAWL